MIFNITNISALSYQSEVGIGFTFNPTLSVSLSSSDLIISNLTPGSSSESNSVNVNVATNNAYGYSLYASVGNSTYNNTNLTHTNEEDLFSSIATNTFISSLDTDNTWGYSYSIDNGINWAPYNGLPLYSSSQNRLTLNTEPAEDTVDFKIAAKASTAQASGTYSNVINFSAIATVSPMTLAEAYQSENKELYHGYYKMQDMTSTICEKAEDIGAQLQVIDTRDDKVYWVSKLADGHCWMTQNLDLDLIQYKTYTHEDTDLGWDTNNFDIDATWTLTTDPSWGISKQTPYFVDNGDLYVYTSGSSLNDMIYESLADCNSAMRRDCSHYHIGNYYNWNAARANGDVTTSICPAKWRLPDLSNNEFGNLLVSHYIIENNVSTAYSGNGFNNIRKSPLYFVRSGAKGDNGSAGTNPGISGTYFYNNTTLYAGYMNFNSTSIRPISNNKYPAIRAYGYSIRCVAR